MPTLKGRRHATLQNWMQATGINQAELAKRAGCTNTHLCNVLSKSRRCSVALGYKLHQITGVPLAAIVEWPPRYRESA